MAALVQTGKYGAINITNTSTVVYYVIKLLSEAYKLQEYTTCDRKICKSDELFFNAQYMNCIKTKHKVVLGKNTTTNKYHWYNTQNCTSISGYNISNLGGTNI